MNLQVQLAVTSRAKHRYNNKTLKDEVAIFQDFVPSTIRKVPRPLQTHST